MTGQTFIGTIGQISQELLALRKENNTLTQQLQEARRHLLNMINRTGEMRSPKDMQKLNDAYDWLLETKQDKEEQKDD